MPISPLLVQEMQDLARDLTAAIRKGGDVRESAYKPLVSELAAVLKWLRAQRGGNADFEAGMLAYHEGYEALFATDDRREARNVRVISEDERRETEALMAYLTGETDALSEGRSERIAEAKEAYELWIMPF